VAELDSTVHYTIAHGIATSGTAAPHAAATHTQLYSCFPYQQTLERQRGVGMVDGVEGSHRDNCVPTWLGRESVCGDMRA
jgi:homoserine kinase